MSFMVWAITQVNLAIGGVLSFFGIIVEFLGAWSFIFGGIVAMAVIRFLIYPFLKVGVAGSDSVRQFKGRKDNPERK